MDRGRLGEQRTGAPDWTAGVCLLGSWGPGPAHPGNPRPLPSFQALLEAEAGDCRGSD